MVFLLTTLTLFFLFDPTFWKLSLSHPLTLRLFVWENPASLTLLLFSYIINHLSNCKKTTVILTCPTNGNYIAHPLFSSLVPALFWTFNGTVVPFRAIYLFDRNGMTVFTIPNFLSFDVKPCSCLIIWKPHIVILTTIAVIIV